jgi:hypothetical protein
MPASPNAVPRLRCALLVLGLACLPWAHAQDEQEVNDVMDLPGITVTAPREEEPEPGPPPRTVEERFRDALDAGRSGRVKETRGANGTARLRARGLFGDYCLDYDPSRPGYDLGVTLVLPTNCPK